MVRKNQKNLIVQSSIRRSGTPAGLAAAMRIDLVSTYESFILTNLTATKKWFNIMVQNNWLEQPPLAPNRMEIAKEK